MGSQRLIYKVAIIIGAASRIIGRVAVMRLFTEGYIVWAANADGDRFDALSQKIGSSQLRTQTSSAPLWLCQSVMALASVKLQMRFFMLAWLRCRNSEGGVECQGPLIDT
jgi:NAD(P)-dependent dehydrogenase (short-subunit alcohol dehydrogenase family)